MKEKLKIVVCARTELYDTKSVIYQNKAVKDKAWRKIHNIRTAPTFPTNLLPPEYMRLYRVVTVQWEHPMCEHRMLNAHKHMQKPAFLNAHQVYHTRCVRSIKHWSCRQ